MRLLKTSIVACGLFAVLAAAPAGTASAQGPTAQVSIDEVRAIIKKIDPDFREWPFEDGKQIGTRGFAFVLPLDRGNVFVDLNVHEDVIEMWTTVAFAPNLNKLPPDLLAKMFMLNEPTHFRLVVPNVPKAKDTGPGDEIAAGVLPHLNLALRVERTNARRLINAVAEFRGAIENSRDVWSKLR